MPVPFAILDSRHRKEELFKTIVYKVLEEGFAIVIVNLSPSILDIFRKKSIELGRYKGNIFYIIKDITSAETGVKVLSKKVWHFSRFHMFFGKIGMEAKIIEAFAKGKMSTIKEVEAFVKDEIVCFIEPVDDELFFYGEDLAKVILQNVLPKISFQAG
ncbi:MAG: hypothetical protein OEV59_05260 [Deltaproteobacteria bacterium]|nr:hypothetical protein [Deltaproteobacteria bacterium]